MKRINQRTVNKKTLESLVYAGAFDTFPQLHRAQYLCVPEGESQTGLEKMIRFGNVVQAKASIRPTHYLATCLPYWISVRRKFPIARHGPLPSNWRKRKKWQAFT
jgi:DNA polymerase-3 subunit alpha